MPGSKSWHVAAAGWGKTRLGAALCIEEAGRGGRAWWVAPSYKVAAVGWRLIRSLALQIPGATVRDGDMLTTFPGGGTVQVRSADNPDSLRGEGLDFVVIDECAYVAEAAWQEALRPALSDRLGRAMFISTPSGRNWFWRCYQRGLEGGEWKSWSFPTSDNPYIEPSEIEEARGDLPERIFRQEYLAEFLESEGTVFRNIAACLNAPETTPAEHAGHHLVMGVDWAKQSDFTCLSVVCRDCRTEVARDRFNQIDYHVQRQRLQALAERWNVAVILAESNSIGEPIIEELQRSGLPVRGFETTATSKPPLIESLALAFEREECQWQADPVWTGELEAYERKVSPVTGRSQYSAPEGMHDDCLLPGTLIRTIGGYRPVENIEEGDLVLTHLGRYQPVEACIKKPFSGKLYTVKPAGGLALSVTYNHPLYMARRDYAGDVSGPYTVRDWVLPGDWHKTYRAVSVIAPLLEPAMAPLKEGDYYQNGTRANGIKLREIAIDEQFASFLGRFIADGHCRKHGSYGMELAFADSDVGEAEPYEEYLESLGVAVRTERFSGNQRGFKLVFASKLLWHIMRTTYDADGERILPEWSVQLGTHLKHTLDAWALADGWSIRGHRIGCTTSRALALAMRDLAMATGRYASIQTLTNRVRLGRRNKTQYWVTIRDEWPYTGHQRRLSEFEYGARAAVSAEDYTGTVYNLQVAEDESFVANGMVVHNCVIARALAWEAVQRAARRWEPRSYQG